jgi:hypothetical protein
MREKKYIETIALSGKTTETATSSGNQEFDSLSWTSDQLSLILGMNILKPDSRQVSTVLEEWALMNEANILLIRRHLHQFNGLDYEIKGYFDKQ